MPLDAPIAFAQGLQNNLYVQLAPFVQKLFCILNGVAGGDQPNRELVSWSDDGESFFIYDTARFAQDVLGHWFKHQNFTSFVRQLHVHKFKKVQNLQAGALSNSHGPIPIQFSCPDFSRDHPERALSMKRNSSGEDGKRKKGNSEEPSTVTADVVPASQHLLALSAPSSSSDISRILPQYQTTISLPAILHTLSSIQQEQNVLVSELADLRRENQLLWQDAVQARQRADRQDHIIGKILGFLGQLVDGTNQQPQRHRDIVADETDWPRIQAGEEDVASTSSAEGRGLVLHQPVSQPRLMLEGAQDYLGSQEISTAQASPKASPSNEEEQFMALFNDLTPSQVQALVASQFPPQAASAASSTHHAPPIPPFDAEPLPLTVPDTLGSGASYDVGDARPSLERQPSHLRWSSTSDIEKDVQSVNSNLQFWVDNFGKAFQPSEGAASQGDDGVTSSESTAVAPSPSDLFSASPWASVDLPPENPSIPILDCTSTLTPKDTAAVPSMEVGNGLKRRASPDDLDPPNKRART